MSRPTRSPTGEGTAWLVADRQAGDYLCYWYAGADETHLVEQGRAATAGAAVSWGRARTPSVRIRTPGAGTSWAGSGPRPDRFARTWSEDDPG